MIKRFKKIRNQTESTKFIMNIQVAKNKLTKTKHVENNILRAEQHLQDIYNDIGVSI